MPLLWLTVYDLILSKLHHSKLDYVMQNRNGINSVLRMAHGVFADGLTLMAENRTNLHELTDIY